MIIKKLIMHNFGIYASTNQFDFVGKKPIVLIGGMNGRGKTTFLEAVLIGLYGSNSFAYSESKYQTYGQYLKSYVNKSDGTLETYVEIEFSMDASEDEVYYVHREWDAKGQRVKEKIWVQKNGENNAFLTENWPMFVENILPSALSSFFFFDGEKIAELAVEDTSAKIKESIKSMLGISVLDLLESDLGKIISRISKKADNNQNLAKLEELREKKNVAINNLQNLDDKIQALSEAIIGQRNELEKKNVEYSIYGGDVVEQRHDLLKQRSDTMASLSIVQDALFDIAAGELPLVLVKSLLRDIQEQGEKEQNKKISAMALHKVEKIYALYSKKSEKVSEETKAFIAFIQAEIGDTDNQEIYGLADLTLYQLKTLNEIKIYQAKSKAVDLITRRDKFQKMIDEIDNYLSVDIDEETLNKTFKDIKALEKAILSNEVEIDNLYKERATLHGVAMTADSEFRKMAESVLSSLETVDDDYRTVKYAHIATEIIVKYRIRLQENKTGILAKTMTECYKKLANKKNMIDRIEMDAETLDFHYLNKDNEEVDKQSLSAGEKQLMVISLLWALAICSKKKLPVIIDTPLSRLDSSHRTALITTYFPNASDQTIILSTDTEITKEYYDLMKNSLGDEFTLEYSDENKQTSIKHGYFFQEVK